MLSYLLVLLLVGRVCPIVGSPNIVILFADDLGYGDLGCYGHPTSTTPNIDQLAEEGLRFTSFYSASPVCSPSRAALLTGRFQTRSGIYPGVFGAESVGGLPHNETTIAEHLKKGGYSTAMVGKWHLGVGANETYLPTNHGFDSYYGIPYSHDMCPCLLCFYPDTPCYDKCRVEDTGCPIYQDTLIVEQPADFLTLTEKYVLTAQTFIQTESLAKRPFFLYMAFQHTHHPQFAGKKFTGSSIRGKFGDSLNELDWAVGEIMSTLKTYGVDNETFVFFTSDNGPSLTREVRGGNPGSLKCGKGTAYEGGLRVPAIARWPGMIAPGRTTAIAATVDLFPTILSIAGLKPQPFLILDGSNLSPLLFKGQPCRLAYFYYPENPEQDIGLYAVRYKSYKAHYYTSGTGLCSEVYPDLDCRRSHLLTIQHPPLLFNIDQDPSEVYPIDPNSKEYKEFISNIDALKLEFESVMEWGPSQMHRGSSKSVEPCATPGCSPFPNCCSTFGSPFKEQDTCIDNCQ